MSRRGKENAEEKRTIYDIKVTRAKEHEDIVFFDLEVNSVMIYGCRYMESDRGDFVAFPSKKGKDGKYYNHVYVKLDSDHVALIDEQIDKLLS